MNDLTDDQLERIDKYLTSELNNTEAQEVASLIATDKEWNRAYALRLAARQAAGNRFKAAMRERFSEIDAKPTAIRTIRPVWLAVAACAAIAVSALLWLLPGDGQDALMASYQKFPNIVAPIEKSGGERTPREIAYQNYESGNYAEAINGFRTLETKTSEDRLYLGLSLLENADYHNAASVLNEVRASSNPRWSEVADWYYGWTLIRQEHLAEAKEVFKHIAETEGHRYQSNATDLLKKF